MLALLRRRLFSSLLTLWAVVTVTFFALRILPGDAIANQLLVGGASEAAVAQRRADLGLDDPLLTQYFAYMAGLLRGDLGQSIVNYRPVSLLIGEQFGATLELALSALAVAVLLGLGLGCAEAFLWPHWTARIASNVSILALSTPVYWSGTVAIFFFATTLHALPPTGSDSLTHLLLPAGVLGFQVAGSIARVTQSSLRQVLEADFVRTAHAKGLRARQVNLRHVLRAGLPPVVTVTALQVGFLLGGTVITEILFLRQGIGKLLRNAVLDQDYPVVQGVVILAALAYSLVNTAADLLHGLLDPRVRDRTR